MPDAARPEELGAVLELIVGEQRRPERMIPAVGDDLDGVRAELEALEPPWTDTVRVVRSGDGSVVGLALVEWDAEVGQAWILGPWVAGDDDLWDQAAGPLADAALAQIPATITKRTLSGDVRNVRLATLARRRGWQPGPVNHVLVADRSLIEGWPEEPRSIPLRRATPSDVVAVDALHGAEHAGTYATAEQLLRGDGADAPVVLVAEPEGAGVIGYAAGRVHPDGEGYIDFVAVDPQRRGAGIGRQLVVALARELLAHAPRGQVSLTVRDERAAAYALYRRLGFRTLFSMVGYSAGPEDGSSAGGA